MIACIDIGGTSIKVGVLELNGKIVYKEKLLTYFEFEKFTKTIINCIENLKKNFNIEGLAISAPGPIDVEKGMVCGSVFLECLNNTNWKEYFKEKLNLKTSIENDANCAALAEVFNGSAKDIKDMLFIVCGTGIGGAIVRDGKIHHGKNLYGGEFGFMIMEETEDGFKNFSQVASTMSMVWSVQKHYKDNSFDGIRVFEEAKKGDKVCKKAIDRFYFNLAKGIFNLQYIYDPEIILLGGAISEREDFIERINEKLDIVLEKMPGAKIKPKILKCTHKADANLIGALANWKLEYE